MLPHHAETLRRTVDYFRAQPGVRALLLGGSIAHGFARPESDVDVMIVVDADEHARRIHAEQLQFYSADLATYAGGYIDGKYISAAFLDQVAERGSEPARFAFADAQILFSEIDDLPARVARIAQYPAAEQASRIARFYAQLQAWRWYADEAAKKGNDYLLQTATSKLQLFGGRLILAHNRELYPFHKWFLAVLARVPEKPAGLVELMGRLSRAPSHAAAIELYTLVDSFRTWEAGPTAWPNLFMADTELPWMHDAAAIDEI